MSSSCQDENDVRFLFSKIFSGMHHAIVLECGDASTSQRKIALSFPCAVEGSHGPVLRVFAASSDILERTLRHPGLHRFVTGLNATVLVVPKTHSFQCFVRDRSADKSSPSAKRRSQARHELLSKPVGTLHARANTVRGVRFSVDVQSQSNGERFLLHVNVHSSKAEGVGSFGAYGLSKSPTAVVAHF